MDTSKIISFQEAQEMHDNYTQKNYQIINDKRDYKNPDSRSYWYSIQELQDYLDFLKKEMPNIDPNKMGVRIYIGNYGDGVKHDGMDVSGYQSIFFYPMNADENLLEDGVSKSGNNADLGYNRGRMSPPY